MRNEMKLESVKYFGHRRRWFCATILMRDSHYYVNIVADYIETELGIDMSLTFNTEADALIYAAGKHRLWMEKLTEKYGFSC